MQSKMNIKAKKKNLPEIPHLHSEMTKQQEPQGEACFANEV